MNMAGSTSLVSLAKVMIHEILCCLHSAELAHYTQFLWPELGIPKVLVPMRPESLML